MEDIDLMLKRLSKFLHHRKLRIRKKTWSRMIKVVGYDKEGLTNYRRLVKYLSNVR